MPIGTGHARVLESLDSLGIEHSGFDSDSSRILAVARGVRKGLITRTDLQLILTFDSSGVLTSVGTSEPVTGP
jgi:hypothetical protein